MITLTVSTDKPQSPFYEQLLGKVDKQILHLHDSRGAFLLDKAHEKVVMYFIRNVIDKPWNNQLLLLTLICEDKYYDVESNYRLIRLFNPRFTDIFNAFQLNEMKEFDVEIHIKN